MLTSGPRLGYRRAARPCSRRLTANSTSLREGPSLFSPGVSSTQGRSANAGAARNAARPSLPISPCPMFAWRSRFEPIGVCESFRCSDRTRPRPSLRVHSLSSASSRQACRTHTRRRTDDRSRDTAPRRSPPPAASSSAASSSNERPSVPPPRPCSRGEARSPRSRPAPLRSWLTRAGDRIAGVSRLRRARVQDDSRGADHLPDPQRIGQRGKRFGANLRVIACAVQQVDGVDQDGIDLTGRPSPRGTPRTSSAGSSSPATSRRLVEDLNRAAAALNSPFDRLRQAARGRDMGSD